MRTQMVCENTRSRLHPKAKATGGFSLVELIVVITITGIIASVIGAFIAGPIEGFFDQARRAGLVDAGQLALVRMGRDLRAALPNSLRISGGDLELLVALDGDRYRSEPPGLADDRLEFNAPDASFNTFRRLGAGQVLPAGLRLAVYPLGPNTGADPYNDAVLTPAGTAIDLAATSTVVGVTEYRVGLNPAHRFPFESPGRRVFLVQGPVTWRCGGGSLLRFDGYAVAGTQAVPPAVPAGATMTVVVADIVQSCTFRYDPGTAQRNAVALLTLELAEPAAPAERVRLARQVHMNNVP
jgi:MSHA biogenesis protein MshO